MLSFQNPANSIWPEATTTEFCSLWEAMPLSGPFYTLKSYCLSLASFQRCWIQTKVIVKENLTPDWPHKQFLCNISGTRNSGPKLAFLPPATLALLPPPFPVLSAVQRGIKKRLMLPPELERVSLIACTRCLLMDSSPTPSFLFWHTGCSELSTTNKSPQGCLFWGHTWPGQYFSQVSRDPWSSLSVHYLQLTAELLDLAAGLGLLVAIGLICKEPGL